MSCGRLRLYHITMGYYSSVSFLRQQQSDEEILRFKKNKPSSHRTITLCAITLNPYNNHEVSVTIILLLYD